MGHSPQEINEKIDTFSKMQAVESGTFGGLIFGQPGSTARRPPLVASGRRSLGGEEIHHSGLIVGA
jgi:hypothetical protein